RIGNKPFHYHWNDTTLAFASELHPVLGLPWVSETPNEDMLAEFLAAEWHARDETLWRGILRLVAAHRMIVDKNGPRIDRYWEPDLWATLAFTSDQEYINHYRELLGDCVRRMARSHRPLACEVSGGLDSSAIFAVAEQLRRNACLPAPGISGYTLAFAEDGEANELAHARAVGAHLGVRIDEIPPSIQPLSWFADVAHSGRDFPGFPNAAMFAGIRQRAVSDGSRVLLTGEGGDEWLQGSRAYYAEELAQRHWRALRDCFRTDAAAFGKAQAMRLLLRHGVLPLLPSGFESGLRRFVHAIRRNGSPDAYWLAPGMHARLESRRRQSGEGQPHRVRSAGQHDLLACLNDAFSDQVMENAERLAARAGIELRYPLRDHRLIQFAFSTPERLRLRGDRSKYLHVQAMQGLLPPSILERTDKAGFSTVFREPLQGMREMLTHAIPARRLDWVTADGMARLYAACQADHQPGWPLWSLWSVYGCDTIHIQI
ncbi:MAG: asparagine synthase-related protein, partial [Lysobacteraceae bacterium]